MFLITFFNFNLYSYFSYLYLLTFIKGFNNVIHLAKSLGINSSMDKNNFKNVFIQVKVKSIVLFSDLTGANLSMFIN